MCRDFENPAFKDLGIYTPAAEEVNPEHEARMKQCLASIPEDIRNAPLEELIDTMRGPRIGEETYQKILAIMALEAAQENTVGDTFPNTGVA